MNADCEKTLKGRGPATSRLRTLHFESLEARLLLSVTAEEQQFVYLLNLARHDPAAYQREAGLAVDLSGIEPRPPLAVNDLLMRSASARSEEMAQLDYFGHQSPVTGDWPNKVARDQGYDLPSGWAADKNFIESIAAGDWYDRATVPLDALIVDQGLPTACHRRHLLGVDGLYAENREVGVGYATNLAATYRRYWAVHLARQANDDVFLTGVVFADAGGNGRYDAGEGLPGVTVQAAGRVAMANEAGGFSLAVPRNGTYRLSASGPGLPVPVTANVVVTEENVEVDIVSGVSGAYLNFAHAPTSGWTNPVDRLDVSDNRVVDALDALQVINHLNTIGPGLLAPPDAAGGLQPPFLDADGDGQVLPHDALLVINDLNRVNSEGEGAPIGALAAALPFWRQPAVPDSPATAASRTADPDQPTARGDDVPHADLPRSVFPSSSCENATGHATVRWIMFSHREGTTADEGLTWSEMGAGLDFGLLSPRGG